MSKEKSFEDWCAENVDYYGDESTRDAWSHQQDKLDLQQTWVKHHQKSAENSLNEKNEALKKLDKANERIKELEDFIGEMDKYLNHSCATNIMCNSQFHRQMKQHTGESDE